MHLVGLTIDVYYDARPCDSQTRLTKRALFLSDHHGQEFNYAPTSGKVETDAIFTKLRLARQRFYTFPTKEFHKNPTNDLVADSGSQTNRQTAGRDLHVRYPLCYFLQNALTLLQPIVFLNTYKRYEEVSRSQFVRSKQSIDRATRSGLQPCLTSEHRS